MIHPADLDILGFFAGEAGDVMVVMLVPEFVAGGAFDVDRADELFFDELVERAVGGDAVERGSGAGDELAGPERPTGAREDLKEGQAACGDAEPICPQKRGWIHHGQILGGFAPLDKCNTVAFK